MVEKGSVTHPIREQGGEILTDYCFGEANTANNSDNQTIHTENKIFNFCEIWAVTIQHHQQGISSRDPGRSGGEGGEKRVDDLQHHQQGTLLHVERRTPLENFPQRYGNVEEQNHREIKRKNDTSK